MQVSVVWLCCPTRAAAAQKKAPTNEGGEEKGAMANPDLEALADKCVWMGEYTYWKEQGTPLNEFQVGMVTPDQVVAFLKKSGNLKQDVEDLHAKLMDVNWKALTGFIYEKDFVEWRTTPVSGKEVCDTIFKKGIPISTGTLAASNALGAWIMDCAWTEAMVRLRVHHQDIEYKALPTTYTRPSP